MKYYDVVANPTWQPAADMKNGGLKCRYISVEYNPISMKFSPDESDRNTTIAKILQKYFRIQHCKWT